MKKYILPFAVFSIMALCFFMCKGKFYAFAKAQKELPQKAPFDLMFMQRAYPTGQIETGAYREAALWKKEKLQNRNSSQNQVWEFSGPLNIGGRITDIEVSPAVGNPIFVGAASGGVFLSADGGSSWSPVFDDQPMLSIGDIAIAPSNPDIVFVGTGEVNAGGGSLAYDGDGVYRSEDAGITWQNIGLQDVGSISKILVHPTDPNILWVGAMGPLFRNDTNRGVYKTTDGGTTWEQVFFLSNKTGVIDMVLDPENSNVIYAATWERERTPENRVYGGATSGIHLSEDGGMTWGELTDGLPSNPEDKGRISIDISQSNPDVMYASYADAFGNIEGFYKSLDKGTTWDSLTTAGITQVSFHWWFGGLFINPENEDEVYHVGFDMAKTTDGGASWQPTFTNVHVDQHAMAFHPSDGNTVYLGNDGGLYTSTNGGASWVFDDTLPITQFYRFYVDPSNDQKVYGGSQDNSTMRTITGGLSDWTIINGGDGFQPLVNKDNTNIIYALSQRGNLVRSTNDATSFQLILNGINPSDRNNWDTPIAFDPQDNDVLYYGTQRVYQSINGGTSWNAISGDLTSGPSTGNLAFGTLTTIDISPVDSDIIYAGSDDGTISVTLDGGASWSNISSGLPDYWVTRVKASLTDPNVVYATFSGYRFGADEGHVFISVDNGSTWEDMTGDLPDIPVNDVELDAFDNVYIGTDVGVFVQSSSATWEPLGTNLPSVVVNDLHFDAASGFMYAGTYGRSSYKLDVSADILSVKEEEAITFEVYPNPATKHFSIKLSNSRSARVVLYNQLGQKVRDFSMSDSSATFMVSDLAKGLYIVQVESGGGTLSRKLIIN